MVRIFQQSMADSLYIKPVPRSGFHRLVAALIIVSLSFGNLSAAVDQTGADQRQSPEGANSLQWQGVISHEPLPLTVTLPDNPKPDAALPVIVYLQNLSAARVGTERDETILQDFRTAGYLVATLDYSGRTNAKLPFLNRDLGRVRDDIRAKHLLGDFNIDMAHVFIVPSGSRLERDVVFYREEERTLALDIIYPAKPRRSVGAVIEFSCDNKDRFGNFSLSVCSDTLLDGFAAEGFAVAMADHPVAPPYKGLDPMPDCAWKIKAAVRTLRAQSHRLGLNERIVPVGFSRGSGMALMLVTTDGMAGFEGHGEHQGVRSGVEGAVVISGRFTYLDLLPEDKMLSRYAKAWGEQQTNLEGWRHHGALDYLNQKTVPLFLTINCSESPDALHQMEVLQKRLAQLNSEFVFQMDNEPRGHKVTLDPEILAAMTSYLRGRLNR